MSNNHTQAGAKAAAKKKSTKKPKVEPTTPEERLAHLEERHNALIAQLKLHGIHLDLGEDEADEEEDGQEAGPGDQKE